MYQDLRQFLDYLENSGELKRIKAEVNWNEEMAAIAEQAQIKNSPALLFENIKDYQTTPCRKFTFNSLGSWKRISMALDLPEDTNPRQLLSIWRERCKSPVEPIVVDTGPCKEVIKKGEDVNLLDFPVPKLHSLDGGRYVLTWHADISKDPETGWLNLGMYRGMYLNKNSIGRLIPPMQHMMVHARKYPKKSTIPVAAAIGIEPVLLMVSCSPFPIGVSEYAMAGALKGEPIKLVKCETNDLLVPAETEIILEGEMSLDPESFMMEGPFGEYTNHYHTLKPTPKPVFKVNCITHREAPIFTACILGISRLAPAECDLIMSLGVAARVWDHLEAHGVQGITGVWGDPGTCGVVNTFVSIDKICYGQAKQVAAALWGTSLSFEVGKFIVVVDSDIDVFDLRQINYAIANRVRGAEDVIIYPGTFGGPLDPAMSPKVREETGFIGRWDRVLIDATWSYEEPREEWGGLRHPPFCSATGGEGLEKLKRRWKEYGID